MDQWGRRSALNGLGNRQSRNGQVVERSFARQSLRPCVAFVRNQGWKTRKSDRFADTRRLEQRRRQRHTECARDQLWKSATLIVFVETEIDQSGGETLADHDDRRTAVTIHEARIIRRLDQGRDAGSVAIQFRITLNGSGSLVPEDTANKKRAPSGETPQPD